MGSYLDLMKLNGWFKQAYGPPRSRAQRRMDRAVEKTVAMIRSLMETA